VMMRGDGRAGQQQFFREAALRNRRGRAIDQRTDFGIVRRVKDA
jgi:hypothetical protein